MHILDFLLKGDFSLPMSFVQQDRADAAAANRWKAWGLKEGRGRCKRRFAW